MGALMPAAKKWPSSSIDQDGLNVDENSFKPPPSKRLQFHLHKTTFRRRKSRELLLPRTLFLR